MKFSIQQWTWTTRAFLSFGSVLLFVAFVAENRLGAGWRQERAKFESVQIMLSLEEGIATQWAATLLVHQNTEKPSPAVLNDAALQFVQHASILTTLALYRGLGDDVELQKALQVERDLVQSAREAHARNDTKRLLEFVIGMQELNLRFAPGLTDAAWARFRSIEDRENRWDAVAFWSFVLGSLLVGVGTVLLWLQPTAGEPTIA